MTKHDIARAAFAEYKAGEIRACIAVVQSELDAHTARQSPNKRYIASLKTRLQDLHRQLCSLTK